MNITEFKAFLEGMDVKDAPTKEQWARIMEKVDTLNVATPLEPCPTKYWPSPITPYDVPLYPYTVTQI